MCSSDLLILSPITPFITEELWREVGHDSAVLKEKWPTFDPKALKRDEVIVVIQVNGKLRDQMMVPAEIAKNKDELEKLALEQIQSRLEGKTVRKVVVVPGKLVSVVV